MGEPAAKAELERLIQVMDRAIGGAGQSAAPADPLGIR
jgi:hypothetical protein